MPITSFFKDVAAAFLPDQIHYVLPEGVDKDNAPSHIAIDGYATLKMQRYGWLGSGGLAPTRDEAVRHPLNVRPATGPVHAALKAGQGKMIPCLFAMLGAAMVNQSFWVAAVNPAAGVLLGAMGTLICIAALAVAANTDSDTPGQPAQREPRLAEAHA